MLYLIALDRLRVRRPSQAGQPIPGYFSGNGNCMLQNVRKPAKPNGRTLEYI